MNEVFTTFLKEDFLILAGPGMYLALALSWFYSNHKNDTNYDHRDTITSASSGSIQYLTSFIELSINFAIYNYLYQNWKLIDLSAFASEHAAILFIGLFLLDDFIYYLFHRFTHRVNIGWAAHFVHHSSEYYNLSTALRQSVFQGLLSMWFYLPLALLGVRFEWLLATHSLNLVYQYWIHSSSVEKLAPIVEAFMNTPSHHRVHHGRNPKYIDKNYAGVLIIWDRLLGTFQVEEETPVYGLVKPLTSYNHFEVQSEYLGYLCSESLSTKVFKDKILVWFKEPGWRPRDLEAFDPPPEVSRDENPAMRFSYKSKEALEMIGLFTVLQTSFILSALWQDGASSTKVLLNTLIFISFLVLGSSINRKKS